MLSKFGVFKETTRGENTHAEKVGAKVRKGQIKKANAYIRKESVDITHSFKLDRSEAQRKERRAKRNK